MDGVNCLCQKGIKVTNCDRRIIVNGSTSGDFAFPVHTRAIWMIRLFVVLLIDGGSRVEGGKRIVCRGVVLPRINARSRIK